MEHQIYGWKEGIFDVISVYIFSYPKLVLTITQKHSWYERIYWYQELHISPRWLQKAPWPHGGSTITNLSQTVDTRSNIKRHQSPQLTIDPAFNTLRPRQNGRHFVDDVFKCIFLNENMWILLKISLKFVPKGPINNIPSLVQIMSWRRPGDKSLSEPMMVSLLTHICVPRPQRVDLTD